MRLSSLCPRLPGVEAYKHQVDVVRAVEDGDDVLLVAGPGAGKTEAALAAAWEAGLPAVFVYPTKALTRDQEERMRGYGFDVVVADGDHPGWRERLRSGDPEVVLTNPHALWYHARRDGLLWEFVVRRATMIVWDEIQYYDPRRANLVLGLIRALRDKRHLLMSGTIGSPEVVAAEVWKVTGRSIRVVHGRGRLAPRTFFACRLGDWKALVSRLAAFATDVRKTIVYARSRAMAEWIARALEGDGLPVAVHHGAMSRGERRWVERAFKEGDLRLVVTVRTLEAGIDVGSVGRVVHLGLPERVADFWQREGRAGRRGEPAESYLVAVDGWSSFVLERRERFERAYLRGELESAPMRAASPLSRQPWVNPAREFYGRGRYRVVHRRDRRRVLRSGVSRFDVVRYYAPGKTFEHGGRVWVVTGRPVDRYVPALPVEEYDSRLAWRVRKRWWTAPATRAVPEGGGDAGLGAVRVTWGRTLLIPPPDLEYRPRVIARGRLRCRIKAFYVRLRDDRLGSPKHRDAAEYAVHALTHAIRIVEGYPTGYLGHFVGEREIVLYEWPAAVLPYLDWERAAREALRTSLSPEDLRLPACPWPLEEPHVRCSLVRRYLRRLVGLLDSLRNRVSEDG